MNFNHPFSPYFNYRYDSNQANNHIPPWMHPSSYPLPPMHFQPPMGNLFQQPPPPLNPLSPLMIHQQNNFYSSNFSSQTLQRPLNASYQKVIAEKVALNVPKQKKKLMLEAPQLKYELVRPKHPRIAEIIQIKDSDELQAPPKIVPEKKPTNIFEANKPKDKSKKELKKLQKEERVKDKDPLAKRKLDPIFIEARSKIIRQEQVQVQGKPRRSKRNSEKISKKIRKIINDEMGSGLNLIRKINKKNYEKKAEEEMEGEEEQMNESCSTDKQYYLERAIMPHQIAVEERPEWKQKTAQNLFSRTLL